MCNNNEIIIRQARFTISDVSGFLKKIRMIGEEYNVRITCFNRESVAGRRHVLSAVNHAIRSFESGDPISRSIEIEALLYAAGTRQTGMIGPFGVHTGENEVYICSVPNDPVVLELCMQQMISADAEDWEGMTPKKKQHLIEIFNITQQELSIVPEEKFIDLVMERVALLDIYR